MARSLAEIRASQPRIDRAKIEATTEEDIARHAREDGSAPVDLSLFEKRRPGQRGPGKKPAMVPVTIRLPAATLRAWQATGEGWGIRMREAVIAATRGIPKQNVSATDDEARPRLPVKADSAA